MKNKNPEHPPINCPYCETPAFYPKRVTEEDLADLGGEEEYLFEWVFWEIPEEDAEPCKKCGVLLWLSGDSELGMDAESGHVADKGQGRCSCWWGRGGLCRWDCDGKGRMA